MTFSRLSLVLACGAFAVFAAPPAFAQASRTWVSGVGDDANPCTRTAPCATFAGAVTKTAAGGEINVVDEGDFGPVTIDKALTISGQGGLGTALATGASVITVAAGPGDVVVLRHLALRGQGTGSSSGISFASGKALHIEGCTIAGFPGDAIHFEPGASSQLVVSNVRASECAGAGLYVASGSATAQVVILRSRFEHNAFGLLARDGAKVASYDSAFSSNTDSGVAVLPLNSLPAEANLEGAILSADNIGLRAEGAAAVLRLSKVTVLDPVTETSRVASGGRLLSFGNNRLLAPVAGDLCIGVTCAAPNACQLPGVCNHLTGTCEYAPRPDGTSCDDNNACTQTDACESGACVGNNPVVCAAKDGCHSDGICDPASGVCSNPELQDGTACDDSDPCTRRDSCLAGVCVGADPVSCTAPDACHLEGTCNPATGLCSEAAEAPDGTACDDGDLCTAIGHCAAGVCTGETPVVCDAPGKCQLAGTCQPSTGSCTYPAQPDGTPCDDESACTRTDTCQAGECAGSDVVECAPPGECLVGTCDPQTGACETNAKPDGHPCSSGICVAGSCAGADAGVVVELESTSGCGCDASGSSSGVEGLLVLVLIVGAFVRHSRVRVP